MFKNQVLIQKSSLYGARGVLVPISSENFLEQGIKKKTKCTHPPIWRFAYVPDIVGGEREVCVCPTSSNISTTCEGFD